MLNFSLYFVYRFARFITINRKKKRFGLAGFFLFHFLAFFVPFCSLLLIKFSSLFFIPISVLLFISFDCRLTNSCLDLLHLFHPNAFHIPTVPCKTFLCTFVHLQITQLGAVCKFYFIEFEIIQLSYIVLWYVIAIHMNVPSIYRENITRSPVFLPFFR